MDQSKYRLRVGPNARWFIFLCADQGHPMKVGYAADEYAEDRCPCGAALVPIEVEQVRKGRAMNQFEDWLAAKHPDVRLCRQQAAWAAAQESGRQFHWVGGRASGRTFVLRLYTEYLKGQLGDD